MAESASKKAKVEGAPASDREELPKMTSSFWFDEEMTPDLWLRMRMRSLTYDAQSAFQRVQVCETVSFGTTLVLDGKTQSTALDEHVYHESLVHPALLLHGAPKRVYIGGGGELATARECLKHASVESVVMVDLDGDVVDVCKKQLPAWNAGSTDDARLEVIIGDARAYLLGPDSGLFDVVILDISDPIEAGPAVHLYTREFYELVARKLTPGGILATQSGPAGLINHTECFSAIYKTMAEAFDTVVPYSVVVPSFGCDWGFNLATSRAGVTPQGVREQLPSKTDAAIAKAYATPLKHYDGQSHLAMFNLIKDIRLGIEAETRIITEANPVFMY